MNPLLFNSIIINEFTPEFECDAPKLTVDRNSGGIEKENTGANMMIRDQDSIFLFLYYCSEE